MNMLKVLLIPSLLEDLRMCRPSRLINARIRMGLNDTDMLTPFTLREEVNRLLRISSIFAYRPLKIQPIEKDVDAEVAMDKDKFQVNLDVQHFSPEEITVKTTGDNIITIEAKHEENHDDRGYISRQFVRKYILPKNHDIKQVESKLSSDGILTIVAPKILEDEIENRTIPIQQTGTPSKSVEEKDKEKAN